MDKIKTTFKQYLIETKVKVDSVADLIRTMKDGVFTKDGSDINISVCRLDGHNIRSLIGSPTHTREFDCSDNHLTSLEGCPKVVPWDFCCNDNEITHLIDGPHKVKDFSCANNKLVSLEGAPELINGDFNCRNNMLKSLEGLPKKILGDLVCSDNLISTLDGIPEYVGGNIDISNNRLTSLKGIHLKLKEVGYSIDFSNNNITSHVLGLLKIKDLTRVVLDNYEVQDIINNYLPEGDIFACQQELIDADFEDHAQL